jgi:murein DD-endopeptidase MepM/ murein hydrolase activator NlpD
MLRAAPSVQGRSRVKQSKQRLLVLLTIGLALSLLGVLLTASSEFTSSIANPCAISCNTPDAIAPTPDTAGSCPVADLKVSTVDEYTKGTPVEISDLTSDGDTLLSLFSMNICDTATAGRVAESLAAEMRKTVGKRVLSTDELRSGRRYAIQLDENGVFQTATIEMDPANVFHCAKEDRVIRSWKEDVVLDYKTEVLSFRVQGDIVKSVLAAREAKELALKLIHVFRWDIDFQVDPRKGDVCKVVFERRHADDRAAGYGRILFAVYEGQLTGRKTACLFNGEYYDENGVELKKDYLRAPLNTLRITSGYGWRIHPVLNVPKFHTGVDYGAPTGTPVFAIAEGTVTFQGCGEAYGLYVCVRHGNGSESRYSHLSRILVKKGQRVKQHQTVGLVGSTGRSTGPHLFFEIIANGKRIDPTKVRLVKNPGTIPSPLKKRFKSVVNNNAGFLSVGRLAADHRV